MGKKVLTDIEGKGETMEISIRAAGDFGPILRDLRKQRALTQGQLSEITGVKQQTISAIESGTRNAEMKTIFAILSALNLELVLRARAKHTRGFAPGRGS